MEASLIVCNEGEFLPEQGTHRLGAVMNQLSIPTVPHVIPLFTLAKLSYLSSSQQHFVQIIAYNGQGEVVTATEKRMVRNQRGTHQVPGIDISFNHRVVFCDPGIHNFKLLVDDEVVAQYPLTVQVESLMLQHQ
ncbi:hypothetical protein PaecuDRAFT_2144 [Paenibacillus curdlanolyticus YK9]|uniref:Uncharacterized protein n=1 Tax=Paenibacillus curdlanolyticus YK9 TaxID=717606 RepID=E0I910_9BACL|nr:hypothetical protein [Paenibacillus curdlanolyticus]EFM10894.1 hypothetical protein PaecuDRAFT_2144 [Paenibacillus curdlanolyticus YK9]